MMSSGLSTRPKWAYQRAHRWTTPASKHSASRPSAPHRSRRPSTGTSTGAGTAGARRSPVATNQPMTTRASAELPYCTIWNTGKPPTLRFRNGSSSVPHRLWWVNASHTTCVAAPSAPETANHSQADGPKEARVHRCPRTKAWTRPRTRTGNSATSGSRSSAHTATSTAAMATFTVAIPARVCVNDPNSIAPGTTVSAK